ncbi:MAG: helical backbone metal receptor [Thiotrichales bacterium]|nr:helical backbone metal receptor [Thiotrichales bacterium]
MRDSALRDAAGTMHAPAPGNVRIVSLVPSITELLFDLGVGSRVVGRTPFCVHPRDGVARVPRVGGTKTPRLDRIRALDPTHVIVNVDENRREDAEALAAFVPNVVVTHPLDPRDNPALYRLVGGIFASGEAVGRLCLAFERAVSALEAAVRGFPERKVLYLIWRDPWMTVSRDTYVSRTLALVNFRTAGDDPRRRYPELVLDSDLLADVDLVLLSTEPFPFKERHVAEVRTHAGARCPSIRLFDGEMASWYGSRAIRAMDYLARFASEP